MNTIIFIWILWAINLTDPIQPIGEYLTLDRLDGCLAARQIHEINSQPHEMFVCQQVPLESWYASRKMGLMPPSLSQDEISGKLAVEKLRLEVKKLRQETGR